MKPIHPSTIKLRDNHCGHAIEMWRQNAPYERDVFHTGVAAHYVLEMCALKPDEDPTIVAQECIQELTTQGRSYDDVPEPPMPVNRALEGAEIAMNWLQYNTLPTVNAHFEEEYAFDGEWNEVPYNSDEAVFQTILDVVEIRHEYDDEADATIKHAIVRDYKTSWAADNSELYTTQRWCQALVVWLRHNPEKITLEIANLRSKKAYTRVVRPLHDGETPSTHTQKYSENHNDQLQVQAVSTAHTQETVPTLTKHTQTVTTYSNNTPPPKPSLLN